MADYETEDCEPDLERKCRGWKLAGIGKIGEKSAVGEIYQVCENEEDCEFVMKVLKRRYDRNETRNQFIKRATNEVVMQNKCHEHDLCFMVKDSWFNDKKETFFIITRMMKHTLGRYLNEDDIDMRASLTAVKDAVILILTLHISNIIHGDTHVNNFMFDYNGNLRFIDLGAARTICLDRGIIQYDTNNNNDYEFVITNLINDYSELRDSLDVKASKNVYIKELYDFIDKIVKKLTKVKNIFGENINIFERISYQPRCEKIDIVSIESSSLEKFRNFDIGEENLNKIIGTKFGTFRFLEDVINYSKILELFVNLEKIIVGHLVATHSFEESKYFDHSKLRVIPEPCRPEMDNPKKYAENCSFVGKKLITYEEAMNSQQFPFFTHSDMTAENYGERLDYLDEFLIFVIPKGTVLVHATQYNKIIIDKYRNGILNRYIRDLWWAKHYPGQKSYGGAWFTYETGYGGPDYFGLFLYYEVQKDLPVLYIPNYTDKLKETNEYIDIEQLKSARVNFDKYRGSHVIQGPKGWKQKYSSLHQKEDYFADGLGKKMAELKFKGYISCDECEVFVTHDAMKECLTHPFRIDANGKYMDDDDDPYLDIIRKKFENDKEDLTVTLLENRESKDEPTLTLIESIEMRI